MRPLDPVAVRLFDENTQVRREAVLTLDTSSLPGLHVLRQVLLTDEDAEVRASAARRLGESRQERFSPALLESARDPLPLVREQSWRALARLGARALLPLARRALREEPIWWVRRAAVRAVGSVPGIEAVELLLQVLEDPFWRVRNAAIQALAWLGEDEPLVRERVRVLAEASPHGPVRAASVYLGGLWGQEPVSAQAPLSSGTQVPSERDNPLVNEDPAVVTSRLERRPASDLAAIFQTQRARSHPHSAPRPSTRDFRHQARPGSHVDRRITHPQHSPPPRISAAPDTAAIFNAQRARSRPAPRYDPLDGDPAVNRAQIATLSSVAPAGLATSPQARHTQHHRGHRGDLQCPMHPNRPTTRPGVATLGMTTSGVATFRAPRTPRACPGFRTSFGRLPPWLHGFDDSSAHS